MSLKISSATSAQANLATATLATTRRTQIPGAISLHPFIVYTATDSAWFTLTDSAVLGVESGG